MKRWKTGEIRDILSDSRTLWLVCVTDDAYGDTVSKRLILYFDEDGPDRPDAEFVQIQGFSTADTVFDDPDDCKIEMIEVTDHSGCGLQSSDRNTARMYADAVSMLRQAGFTVVPDMKAYF